MPVLKLEYKGFSLNLPYKHKHFYATQEFEPGKTLYQILFEHLVDGKEVSLGKTRRKYKKVNFLLKDNAIFLLIKRIESALKKSPNPKLKAMRFLRPPRGGANPVLFRKSTKSRYTQAQKAIIVGTIQRLHKGGKRPTDERLKVACVAALKEASQFKNVKLWVGRVKKIKEGLDLPSKGQPVLRKLRRA